VRCVLDPGVLVAAIITPLGPPAQILRSARSGGIEVVVSPHLLSELAAVLSRDKLRRYVSADEASEYVEGLARLGITVADPPRQGRITRDPDDDYLVALARASGADVLVSGDRDLLEADVDVIVLTPRELVRRLDSGPREAGDAQ
jgi:putative PIN family toxin of toxin-antitoxin system